MFGINVTLYSEVETKDKWVYDKELADFYFFQLAKCDDVRSVIMTDGFTGEVLQEFSKT